MRVRHQPGTKDPKTVHPCPSPTAWSQAGLNSQEAFPNAPSTRPGLARAPALTQNTNKEVPREPSLVQKPPSPYSPSPYDPSNHSLIFERKNKRRLPINHAYLSTNFSNSFSFTPYPALKKIGKEGPA